MMRVRQSAKRGQAAILATLTLVPTLGMLGLVVDVGWAYWRREACQTAANSAAEAAALAANNASNLTCGSGVSCTTTTCTSANTVTPPANNLINGCLYAKQNGFLNSGNQTVTMAGNTSNPPVGGVSPSYWVSATVSEKIFQTFSAVLGGTATKVSYTAVAGVFTDASSGCFYLMGASNTDLSMSGGSISSNCGVYVNSTGAGAITQSGGTVTVSGGGQVYNRGGYIHSGGSITPAPQALAAAVTDPFASLPVPAVGACTDDGISVSGGSATLQPGVHCGGVSVSGGTLTLVHGLHIFEAGMSMGVSGGTVVDDGDGGVTLFMDGNDGLSQSGGSLTLHAPTAAGTYMGILIFYSRTNNDALNLSGGTISLTGAVYALDSTFDISGGTFTNVTFVVNNLNASGGSTVNGGAITNYTGGGGSAIPAGAYLVQ